ncbi:peroxisomal acyl-coenzyme A oxidase 3 isoform X8 [Globicephala melas]|uniref:peroxisomal acyl-coenzyme A oxidase 3 isoform X8 n=1 Tax=Globicephala melas TaxID=9731 RepID=UPI00293D4461|nr:peroxisomal acyl-coenzyme A oxidase 3 isoform X8 [Globicephala melas]
MSRGRAVSVFCVRWAVRGLASRRAWRVPKVAGAMAPLGEGSDDPVLPDLPRGPLHAARARASFPWKELALFWEGPDMLRFKKNIFLALENDPLFAHPPDSLSLEKYRELNFLRCKRVFEYDFLRVEDLLGSPLRVLALIQCLGMYDWSLATKFFLHTLTFGSAIYSSGSERHFKYLPKIFNMEIFGCFALTEVSHGSNTKAMRTTAHYDPTTEELIIHSPDFEAAKFWVGNLGKTATHAVVFAQLYTPGGQCHGLHPFVVQIRDPKTLLPMPGVMVGDIGRKLGQNGLDNGFAMFHKVRIPRQDLLNRSGDITPEGTYVTHVKDARQHFSESLGSLSSGRVAIAGMSVVNLKLAVSIALRFSATRRQFGPTDEEEVLVLEYPMQQWRLLPYLAAAYALDHFSKSLFLDLVELQQGLLGKDRSARQSWDARSTPWRRPASPWPRGRPSAESRSAGRRAEDTAIWPVGFGDTWAGLLSSPAPCGSRPGVGKRQPAGQRPSLWVKVFVNKDLLAPGSHPFVYTLPVAVFPLHPPSRAVSAKPKTLTGWGFPERVCQALPESSPSARRYLMLLGRNPGVTMRGDRKPEEGGAYLFI